MSTVEPIAVSQSDAHAPPTATNSGSDRRGGWLGWLWGGATAAPAAVQVQRVEGNSADGSAAKLVRHALHSASPSDLARLQEVRRTLGGDVATTDGGVGASGSRSSNAVGGV